MFCRWRGEPPFGATQFEQLVGIVDRLIVDSAEWGEPALRRHSSGSSSGPRSRTSRGRARRSWRAQLARFWPSIREQEIYVRGPRAEATLLRAWLGARLGRAMRPIEAAPTSSGVRLGGEELAAPARQPATPSDLLSAELDRYGRDPIYEEAVAAAAARRRLSAREPTPSANPRSQIPLRQVSETSQRTKCANFVPIHARPWRSRLGVRILVSMAYPKRIDEAGSYHHVNSVGGLRLARVFRDDVDRAMFLGFFEEELER